MPGRISCFTNWRLHAAVTTREMGMIEMVRRIRVLAGIVLALGMIGFASLPAKSAVIVGGLTTVELTAAPTLTGLGLTVSPLGTASVFVPSGGTLPQASFPITGGTTGPAGAIIEHDGSGLRLSDGTDNVDLENFIIDTFQSELRSDVSVNGAPFAFVPLFDIVGPSLNLTAAAAGALSSVFGIDDLTGAEIARVVSIDPEVVPAPGALALLGLGVLGLGAYRRVRSKNAASSTFSAV